MPTAVFGNHSMLYADPGPFTEYKTAEGEWVRPRSLRENLWANFGHLYRSIGAMTLELRGGGHHSGESARPREASRRDSRERAGRAEELRVRAFHERHHRRRDLRDGRLRGAGATPLREGGSRPRRCGRRKNLRLLHRLRPRRTRIGRNSPAAARSTPIPSCTARSRPGPQSAWRREDHSSPDTPARCGADRGAR